MKKSTWMVLLSLPILAACKPSFYGVVNETAELGDDVEFSIGINNYGSSDLTMSCFSGEVALTQSYSHVYPYVGVVPAELLSLGQNTVYCSATNEYGTTDKSVGFIKVIEPDNTAPVLSLVYGVSTPNFGSALRVVFHTDESGTIAYSGSCSSLTSQAVEGNHTLYLADLAAGTYSDCAISVTDANSNTSDSLAIPAFEITSPSSPLNDTGYDYCADYAFGGSTSHQNQLVCADQVSAPGKSTDGTEVIDTGGDVLPQGQDSVYGRDATDHDDSDGAAGFSFTKLASDGSPLEDQTLEWSDTGSEAASTQWACVLDNVTGLMWETKHHDSANLQYKHHRVTWYNSAGVNDGGDHGVGDTGVETTTGFETVVGLEAGSDSCIDSARCDTEKYVADVNALNTGDGICGYNDWRLPTKEELVSVVDHSKTLLAYDTDYFPNFFGASTWTSSPYAGDATMAWVVGFHQGTLEPKLKSERWQIMLVRGE